MLEIDMAHCTGCGACVQKCPKRCISLGTKELGHVFPIIDKKNCIDCNLCEKVCPINQPIQKPEKQGFFAIVSRDIDVLMHSTSGGFFTVAAKYVLNKGGLVYGCSFENHFRARHIRIDDENELWKLRGSKYIQSDTNNTFHEAEKDLKSGRYVLFTGTPCQIAGLYAFLGRPYENLLTVDIVCHGVGSQAFFDKYMNDFENHYGSVKELHFRDKEQAGWSCGGSFSVMKKGKTVRQSYYDYNNYYYYYFLHGDIYRQSCYSCKYANTNRPGDFTMGDFWGVEKYDLPISSSKGCSLVIANTSRAQELLKVLENQIDIAAVTMEQAIKANGQLSHPTAESPEREALIHQFASLSGGEIRRLFRKNHKQAIFKLWIKAMIPFSVRQKLRKIMR